MVAPSRRAAILNVADEDFTAAYRDVPVIWQRLQSAFDQFVEVIRQWDARQFLHRGHWITARVSIHRLVIGMEGDSWAVVVPNLFMARVGLFECGFHEKLFLLRLATIDRYQVLECLTNIVFASAQ